ncbi:hypothetical protein TNCT_274941 [Trichonephila clavata]|uniref:Uncharacterized protein n=1 Tax=Trichonephila clavata TaxID=2740835 RepID=A0A8X6HD74_TRICU|nr:hypothetical protein TNCT_274941 [Trichonephila clavata]
MSRVFIAVNGFPSFPEHSVPHENLALVYYPVTVCFPKLFTNLYPIFNQFQTKLNCITLLQKVGQFLLDEGGVDTFAQRVTQLQQLPTGD